MLLMNKLDQPRPLDARPGLDPFDGTDATYSCDGAHSDSGCLPGGPAFAPAGLDCTVGRLLTSAVPLPAFIVRRLCNNGWITLTPPGSRHNELLGGHGSDVIHAGPDGDVLWGDYKPARQPTAQRDALYGGPGADYIYASHGRNDIRTGGGDDVIHAHFGRGTIHCEGGDPIVYLSRKSRRVYHLSGCARVSYFTRGY